jgi:hypothetical protein
MRPREWTFPYAAAVDVAGQQEALEPGDELGLRWRGALQRPELAPPGDGRPAIVTRVDREHGIAKTVTVSLIAEGLDGNAAP